jgi:transcriptional regulator with XRE-family HTH domain
METTNLKKEFSARLRLAMLNAGLGLSQSKSGVSLQAMADISECSLKISRRYLSGESIPEPTKLKRIAQKLKISPGWLLFGELNEMSKEYFNA